VGQVHQSRREAEVRCGNDGSPAGSWAMGIGAARGQCWGLSTLCRAAQQRRCRRMGAGSEEFRRWRSPPSSSPLLCFFLHFFNSGSGSLGNPNWATRVLWSGAAELNRRRPWLGRARTPGIVPGKAVRLAGHMACIHGGEARVSRARAARSARRLWPTAVVGGGVTVAGDRR
jgi:hypothetical protein